MKGPFYLAAGAIGAAALIFTVGACLPDEDDPYNGVPQCTDAIADAGGICHGEPIPNHPTITLIPCPTEDSADCYWNAATMGNGQGRSFVNIDGNYYYQEAGNE
jgi:hypothetical protein